MNVEVNKQWNEGYFHTGVYDDKNLSALVKQMVEDNLDLENGFHRKVTIGMTNMPELDYKRVDLDKIRPASIELIS